MSRLGLPPVGKGKYDIPAIFACLAAMNYQGCLSGEWIDCVGLSDLGAELAAMKTVESAIQR